jgi:hypothetical protein
LEGGSSGAELEAEELRLRVHRIMRRLIKSRVYHKALTPIERGILYITSKPGLKLTSSLIRRTLSSIFEKAERWLKPSFILRASSVGRELALAYVRAAALMGHRSAESWLEDRNYIILLGVNALGGGGFGWAVCRSR